MLGNLRLILPAGVVLVWALQKLVPRAAEPSAPPAAEQEEGEEVEVELPAAVKGSQQSPFAEPAPLKSLLLDVTLPMPLAAVWLALFHGSSSLLSEFHQQLGDLEIRIAPWRRQQDGAPRRVMHYTTPLRNAFGPRQALNTEVLEATSLSCSGFCISARCSSEGVPFGSSFANYVQWVAVPQGTHSCRLQISGECRFSSPVWGPLKGQIERESQKGMAKAYRTLLRMLERKYAGVEAAPAGKGSSSSSGAAPAGLGSAGKLSGRPVALGADATAAGQAGAAAGAATAADEGFNISALLQSPQTNAAAFLAVIIVMVLVWRLAFMQQAMLLQMARGVASAVRR